MPQLNPEFFVSQIFWLAIAFFFVYAFVAKYFAPIMAKSIYGREEQINSDISSAKDILEACKYDKDSIALTIEKAKDQAFKETSEAARKAELFLKEEIGKLDLEISAKMAAESERLSRYKNQIMKETATVSDKLASEILRKFSETHNININ